MTSISRRRFLQGVAATAAAAPFISVTAKGQTLAKVRHASIGSSGMAFSDVNSFSKHPAFELVAVADTDLCSVARLQERFPKVRIYQDWRELLKRESKNLDSVNVSTPDHVHAIVAMEAMKRGKHVYCQKPMAATLRETRILTETAHKRRIISQMGIQISSTTPQRLGEAIARSGAVGKIKEVHLFCEKAWGDDKPIPEGADPVPPTLDWDLWTGVAQAHPYKKGVYHPGQWRKRVDFGTGTLGDMGCHIFSPPYRALKLTSPISITSHGAAPTAENWALRAKLHYVFPGNDLTDGKTLDFWWYDGGETAPAHVAEAAGDKLPKIGSVLIGTEGVLVLPHMAEPVILPDARGEASRELVAKLLAEIAPRDHYAEFLDAVLAGKTEPGPPTRGVGALGWQQLSTSFDYAGPLTEAVLLGNVAGRFPGQTLEFDARTLTFPNQKDANAYATRKYRKGWEIKA